MTDQTKKPLMDVPNQPGDGIQHIKDMLNQYQVKSWVPLVGGTGVGDMMVGEAPSMYRDIANEGIGAAFTPEYAARKGAVGPLAAFDYIDSRMLDLTSLGIDITGIGAGFKAMLTGSKGAIKAVSKEISKPTNVSRRDFGKKVTAIGGSAIVGGGLLKMAGKAVKEGGEQTTKHATDNVTVTASKRYKYNTLDEYLNQVSKEANQEVLERLKEEVPSFPYKNKGDLLSKGEQEALKNFNKKFMTEVNLAKTRRMKLDEAIYMKNKRTLDGLQKGPNALSKERALEYLARGRHENVLDKLDEFSPLAKEEMAGAKALADTYRIPWTEYVYDISF